MALLASLGRVRATIASSSSNPRSIEQPRRATRMPLQTLFAKAGEGVDGGVYDAGDGKYVDGTHAESKTQPFSDRSQGGRWRRGDNEPRGTATLCPSPSRQSAAVAALGVSLLTATISGGGASGGEIQTSAGCPQKDRNENSGAAAGERSRGVSVNLPRHRDHGSPLPSPAAWTPATGERPLFSGEASGEPMFDDEDVTVDAAQHLRVANQLR